jgi:drug/metabolite transporter (DMT)-like permease
MNPGTIMLVGLIAAHFMLKDRITRYRALGGAGILLGLWLLAIGAPESGAYPDSLIGDAFFLSGGILWALYTVVLKIWPTDPITIIARITVLSLVGILVALPVLPPISFEGVPTDVLIYQGAWQGFLSSIVALILYNRGVALMGAARAGVTNAIIPVISTILAFVVLSEIPTPIEALGLAAILTGIAIAMFMNSKPKLPIPGAQPTGPQKI